MYKVFIADDEPMAVDMIRKILEKNCPDFEVCGTADNGRDASNKVRDLNPDVVMTDIEMPLVNGIDIARTIYEEMPDTMCVIISGYENFSYAQGAIRANVVDYILKPVIPSTIRKTMENIREKLDRRLYEKRNRAIKAICSGENLTSTELTNLFPYKKLMLGMIRKNGLPIHFGPFAGKEIYSSENESFVVYGRDEMESLYIIPVNMMNKESMYEYLVKMGERISDETDYITGIYFSVPLPPEDLSSRIHDMYNVLDRTCTIGRTQILEVSNHWLDHRKNVDTTMSGKDEDLFFKSAESMMQLGNTDALRKAIIAAYDRWDKEKLTQYQIKYYTFRLRYLIDYYLGISSDNAVEEEYLLNDLFTNSVSVKDLVRSLLEIFFKDSESERKKAPKLDSPEFFHEIETYMKNNMKEALSLQGICKTFCVSQTYISKMFRKYSGLSFNQKLTEIRIEQAKEMMKQNPDIYIKDVAAVVGYADQFYFSRVFRSYTGKSPSEYIDDAGAEALNVHASK